MTYEPSDSTFIIRNDDENSVRFETINGSDCRLSIRHGYRNAHDTQTAVTVDIASEDIIAFILWTLPPDVTRILREHGYELAKVY